jgi:hypothetical protein
MSILLGQKETRKDAYHCDVKPFAVVLKKTDCQAGYADFFQKVGNSFEAVFDFHRLLLLPSLCHGRRSLSLTFCWWNHQWKRLQNVTASMEIPLIVALLLTHSPPQRLIFGANPVGLLSWCLWAFLPAVERPLCERAFPCSVLFRLSNFG